MVAQPWHDEKWHTIGLLVYANGEERISLRFRIVKQPFGKSVESRYNRDILESRKEPVIVNFAPALKPSRALAVAEALVVNLVWASSFVLVKIGLYDLGPLTLAGLRYFIGFLVLLPWMAHNGTAALRALPPRRWIHLILIGVCAYPIGNGALFWGLQYMPATTGSFLLSFTPLLVLGMSIFWLREIPTRRQGAGMAVAVAGSVLFFSAGLMAGNPGAITVVAAGLVGFAFFGILGRAAARDRQVDTLSLTAIPLAFGGGLLLCFALPLEGLPRFSALVAIVVFWLAVVNTAFAYMLYNHSLQVLTAFEMNVMMNLTPLVTAALAWLFLSEKLDPLQIVGMVTAIGGIVLVQWRESSG